ncbi:MAG: sec-independent protein translocase protein TatA [Solirubrobacteraceae bacterium]|jgi:sec-independent protein translocase protein TatA|nr:sec-independent protein translocase protein TatA [Solirubrobacteraceae bacterium]
MPGGIGPLELVIVLVIVLVVFGPKRLPSLGRQLGAGMREFKDSVTGKDKDREDEEDVSAQITRATEAAGHPTDEKRVEEPQPRA